jgi:hypothetical protein
MKTLIKLSLFVLAVFAGSLSLHAQSAEEIVAKSIDAVGGASVLQSVKSEVMESNISVMGNDAPSTTTILSGKGWKSETDFNGSKIITCVTDKGGWTVNPFMGATSPTALPDEQYKAQKGQIYIGGALYNYASNGSKIELQGTDSADYKIKLTTAEGVGIMYYISKKTYYVDKYVLNVNVQGQDMEITFSLSDYRKTDNGLVVPWAIEQVSPQYTLDITHKKVTINPPVDESVFAMPK